MRNSFRTLLVFFMLSMLSIPGKAQFGAVDSVRNAYHNGYKVIGGLSGHHSILEGQPVRIYKLYVGVDFSQVFKLYSGINFMPQPIYKTHVRNAYTSLADTITTSSHISYLSLAFEYSFYRKERWKFSMPAQIGIGGNALVTKNTLDNKVNTTSRLIVPLESGINGTYYFNRWLGLKGGIGMRLVLGKEAFAGLSGPYYNFGIAIFFGEIYKMIFKPEEPSSTYQGLQPYRQIAPCPLPGGN